MNKKITREQRYQISLLAYERIIENVQKEEVINELNKYLGYGYLHQCTLVYNSVIRQLGRLNNG